MNLKIRTGVLLLCLGFGCVAPAQSMEPGWFAYVNLGSVEYSAFTTVTDGVQVADAELGFESSAKGPVLSMHGVLPMSKHAAIRLAWDRYLDVGTEDVTGDVDADLVTLGLRFGIGWFR